MTIEELAAAVAELRADVEALKAAEAARVREAEEARGWLHSLSAADPDGTTPYGPEERGKPGDLRG